VLRIDEYRRTDELNGQHSRAIVLVSPDTVLRRHRALVRRTWVVRRLRPAGRPRIDAALAALILRLARENPCWGYGKIRGALCTLDHATSRSTVRAVRMRHRTPPVPARARRTTTQRAFLRRYRRQMLAGDFFVVETAFLRTIDVLFLIFIELGSRRVHLAGCTQHPTAA